MKKKEEILAKWRQPLKEKTGHDIEKICLLEAMEEYAQAYHEEKTRWISVEERLPEKSGYFNVAYFNPIAATKELYTVTVYNGRNGWYWDNAEKEKAEDLTLTITHWQPLPTPPTN